MFECFICRKRGLAPHAYLYGTARSFKRHLFGEHQHEKGFRVTCGIDGCQYSAAISRNLDTHLATFHGSRDWTNQYLVNVCEESNTETEVQKEILPRENVDVTVACPDCECDSQMADDSLREQCDDDMDEESMPEEEEMEDYMDMVMQTTGMDMGEENDDIDMYLNEMNKSSFDRKKDACLGLVRLKADHNLTNTAVESIKSYVSGMLSRLARIIIGGIKKNIDHQNDEKIKNIRELALGLANPYYDLTEHNIMKYMVDELGYIEPDTITLLEETTLKGVVTHKMQYISIIKVMDLLFQNEAFTTEIETSHCCDDDTVLKDFCDGDYFKNHPLFQSRVGSLQLQLYYDDFETANPLGSKTGTHKTGALYYTFLNLHPRFRSNLRHIFLLALFYTEDLKHGEIGWEKILEPLNRELAVLESEEGCTMFTCHGEKRVHGTLAQFSMDNLAAHSLFGFQMKFSGNLYISRFCHCTGDEIQERFHEGECTLRTLENYADDLDIAEMSGKITHGVKERCSLKSKYFHPIENYAADAHHDILEGVVPQTLKPILKVLISTKQYFDLSLLNDRIQGFDYNSHDEKNKPSSISALKLSDNQRNLRQNASQYWCLMRKLPLLVGDKVSEDDEHWQLLLLLNRIVEIILAPEIEREVLPYLQMLICMFLSEYRRLCPECSITPKMHNMLHYPRLIKMIGPLRRHWVMRYEGKHKILKKIISRSGNFINTAYTMAKIHQLQQIVAINDKQICSTEMVVEKGKQEEVEHLQAKQLLHGSTLPAVVTSAERIHVNGLNIKCGQILVLSVDNSECPYFGEIAEILVFRDSEGVKQCLVVFEILISVVFDGHYHAWEVLKTSSPEQKIMHLRDIPDLQPVSKHQCFERERLNVMYLACKHRYRP